MENIANNIAEYRRKMNLTQKDLGDMLNISPQAVSKWENGQAEPDTSTIKRLCQIFKITTDELLGLAEPAQETAAATAVAEQPAQPAQTVQQIVEQKIINGYCETCRKPVGPGEYVVTGGGRTTQHVYCNGCNAKRLQAECEGRYAEYKRQNKKSVILGTLIGLGAAAIFCILFMLIVKMEPLWATALVAVGVFIGYTAFGIQVFWEDSVVPDVFCFFLKSFRMPGVIFTLDIDGIIFLILVKVLGAILGAILSVLVFIFGLFFTPVASIFILPFAAIKRALEGRQLKKDVQSR